MLIFLMILCGIGIIIFLYDLIRIITYTGKTEGKIMDMHKKIIRDYDCANRENYKYTITYIVNGKTYIHQQKGFSSLYLNNKKVIVKYNPKKPQKSKIKGESSWLIFGIVLTLFSIIIMIDIMKGEI